MKNVFCGLSYLHQFSSVSRELCCVGVQMGVHDIKYFTVKMINFIVISLN